MKITDFEIENFLSIGEAKLRLDGLGLVHISGENLDETSADSNGSGKSSIGDAISWCLWGTTARGVSADDVVNTAAGKNCRVAITIDDAGDIYRVTRYRKAAKHKNALVLERFENNAWTDLSKGTGSMTQKQIERLLGCSEEVFNAAVYSGQENIPDIPRMTDKQLKILVEQAAGVDVLASAYEVARLKLRERSETRANAQISLDRAQQRHQDSLDAVQRVSDQTTQWEANQANTIAQLKADTVRALAALETAKAQFDEQGEASVKAGIAECEAKISAVSGERQREQLLNSESHAAQQAHQTTLNRVSLEERSGQTAADAITKANADLQRTEASVGAPCTSCKRPLDGKHLEAAIAAARQKVEDAKKVLEDVAGRISKAKDAIPMSEKMMQNAGNDLAQHRAAMTDVSAEGDRLRNLQRELQLNAAHKAEVERLKQNAQNVAMNWKRETLTQNPYNDMIEQANQEILDRAADMHNAGDVRATAQTEEAYAQAVVDVYAPAGVRAHRLDEATPFLNDRTAHYLGSLADGAIDAFWTTVSETKAKGNLVEKFSVTVEKAGSAPTFNALSGGEKRKVRLACALALQDLVATRAAKSIELFIGDEIDDALDPAGLERLMSVLEEKARERGTVIVISHNEIAAYARTHWTVVKKNGRAIVRTT